MPSFILVMRHTNESFATILSKVQSWASYFFPSCSVEKSCFQFLKHTQHGQTAKTTERFVLLNVWRSFSEGPTYSIVSFNQILIRNLMHTAVRKYKLPIHFTEFWYCFLWLNFPFCAVLFVFDLHYSVPKPSHIHSSSNFSDLSPSCFKPTKLHHPHEGWTESSSISISLSYLYSLGFLFLLSLISS